MMLFRKMLAHARIPASQTPTTDLQRMLQLRAFSATMMHGQGLIVSQKVKPFNTDTPAKSNRNARGLYHGKTHGQRFQRCFSMKKSIITMMPNVKSRNLRSDTLDMSFKLDITTKAKRCIMKAGSLDNYLLQTKPEKIDSKFGVYLRSLIQ